MALVAHFVTQAYGANLSDMGGYDATKLPDPKNLPDKVEVSKALYKSGFDHRASALCLDRRERA